VGAADDYLTPTYRVGSTVATVVEQDFRLVVGFDYPLEVGQEGAITAAMRVVRTNESSSYATLATPLGDEEVLAL